MLLLHLRLCVFNADVNPLSHHDLFYKLVFCQCCNVTSRLQRAAEEWGFKPAPEVPLT